MGEIRVVRDFVLTGLLALFVACGGGDDSNGSTGGGNDAGATGDGAGGSSDGGVTGQQDGALPSPPKPTCDPPATPVDVSSPKTIVGHGNATDCTETAFRNAVAAGGIVTFDCGADPVTITVTSEVPVNDDTTIDGAGKVTLSGGGTSRILHITSAANLTTPLLTVQNLTFTQGFTTDVMNTSSTREGGAAIFVDGGSLTVIDCTFTHNQCASTGEDVSGGAINGQSPGNLIVVGSIFSDNSGSNGGAIGTQDMNVTVANTVISTNSATGTGGNPGNGGDGGGLSYDGAHISLTLCGDVFTGNKANAAGGALFRVGYNSQGGDPSTVSIDRSTFDGNSVDVDAGNAAGLYLEDLTLTMTATTISNNTGHYGGGLWAGHNITANLTNVTIADNTASGGGGIWFSDLTKGTFQNVTVAGNTGDGLFNGDTNTVLQNSIVANNVRGTLDSTTNCASAHGSNGANLQFPNDGKTSCTSDITFGDPMLGPLADNGGPVKTMLPASGSAAIGKGVSCAATDATGASRPSACTLGAAEAK